jgi:hypothetical protein
MLNKDEIFAKLGLDEHDKMTLANFCVCFGVTGLVTTLFVGTDWYITAACAIASAVVVLVRHYQTKPILD